MTTHIELTVQEATLTYETRWDDHVVDHSVSCSRCDAVCCRLTVVLQPDEVVPAQFVGQDERGVRIMARGVDGWCSALDRERMCCGIYEQRPSVCRKFAMGSAYCRDERAKYTTQMSAKSIPLRVM
ncbi:MAG: YkgJ family cysteine cluster protein [Dokdonella sp.]